MSQWTDAQNKALLSDAKKSSCLEDLLVLYPACSKNALYLRLQKLGFKFRNEVVRLDSKEGVAKRQDTDKLKLQIAALEKAEKHLLSELADRESQLKSLDSLRRTKLVPITSPNVAGKNPKRRAATPVALFSDWHVEEPVKPETVNGLNEYNLAIAEKCIDRCADAYEWFTHDSRFDMRHGVIWLGGDLFSGYIHEELMESNFLSPVEAVVWLQKRIIGMLKKILSTTNFEMITVVCNDGNHGRLTHKIRVSTRTKNSLEWLMYKTIAAAFAEEPRLQFQIADGEWTYLNVYQQVYGFTHGDSFRYLGGVGGLLIPVRRGLNEMRKYVPRLDHVSMGHFHQRMDLSDISVNGSMIGVNGYSMHIHASPERRQQSWFLVDAKEGKCLSAPIWL